MSFINKVTRDAQNKADDAHATRLLKVGTNAFYAVGFLAFIAVLVYVSTFGTALSDVKGD